MVFPPLPLFHFISPFRVLKAPEPVEPWSGILDATNAPKKCVQPNIADGREDCLYLNVYTPKRANETRLLLPVMFWIHGGSFAAGHGGPELFGPEYFMDKDVVLVSINYRLGIFGQFNRNNNNNNNNVFSRVYTLNNCRNRVLYGVRYTSFGAGDFQIR